MNQRKIDGLVSAVAVFLLFLILAAIIWGVALVARTMDEKERQAQSQDKECAVLANIGRHRGETIVIYGDMPTWKLQCLFEGERN